MSLLFQTRHTLFLIIAKVSLVASISISHYFLLSCFIRLEAARLFILVVEQFVRF